MHEPVLEKPRARIEDWIYSKKHSCLIGKVTYHPNQESFKKTFQVTSKVLRLDRKNKVAETQNTIYELGNPGDYKEVMRVIG